MVELAERISDRHLTAKDNVSEFECGSSTWAVDVGGFLRDDALNQQSQGINKTRLFYLDGELAGFVSLLAYTLQLRKVRWLPNKIATHTTVPAVLLDQIGVDSKYQHQGIARLIMRWTHVEVSQSAIGARCIVLHCHKDNPAIALYKSEEYFIADPKGTDDLMLMAKDIYRVS